MYFVCEFDSAIDAIQCSEIEDKRFIIVCIALLQIYIYLLYIFYLIYFCRICSLCTFYVRYYSSVYCVHFWHQIRLSVTSL